MSDAREKVKEDEKDRRPEQSWGSWASADMVSTRERLVVRSRLSLKMERGN